MYDDDPPEQWLPPFLGGECSDSEFEDEEYRAAMEGEAARLARQEAARHEAARRRLQYEREHFAEFGDEDRIDPRDLGRSA